MNMFGSISALLVKVAIAFLAIFVGVIKHSPHLIFKLPNGFILHAISGGKMPPYFDETPYQPGSNDWLKPNDIIVSTAAKSGTTWMLYCSHQIRVKGDDETYPFKDVMYSTPWPDLVQVPGQTWEERLELMTSDSTIMPDGTVYKNYWDHADYDFRVFKSHNTPEQFGDLIAKDSNSKVKFLAMARNGLDQVASAAPFFDKHDADFRKIWGGFPPADGGAGDKRREVASERLRQMLPGNMFGAWHFDYINSWWKLKDQKNVLLLHFSDAKKDLKGTVSKIADFYGVRLNAQEKNKITEKCSFEYMKKNGDLFLYSLPLNPDYDGKVMAKGSMTRKGAVGEGGALFSDEEKQLWEKAEQDQFGDDPEKLNWARNGGGFTSN